MKLHATRRTICTAVDIVRPRSSRSSLRSSKSVSAPPLAYRTRDPRGSDTGSKPIAGEWPSCRPWSSARYFDCGVSRSPCLPGSKKLLNRNVERLKFDFNIPWRNIFRIAAKRRLFQTESGEAVPSSSRDFPKLRDDNRRSVAWPWPTIFYRKRPRLFCSWCKLCPLLDLCEYCVKKESWFLV